MSDGLYANVILPLSIGVVGVAYAIWARWNYERAMDREGRLEAERRAAKPH